MVEGAWASSTSATTLAALGLKWEDKSVDIATERADCSRAAFATMNTAATNISVPETLGNAPNSLAEMKARLDREGNGDQDQPLRDAADQAVDNTLKLTRRNLRARGGS